jgi:phenylpropionate dioxygenase-like ring-hydroxylating dioxygenase large terminal subunit
MTTAEVVEASARYSEASTIPKSRYTSKEFLELEYKHLWSRVWQIAGREEEIRNPGDYLEYSIGDQSVVIVRGEDGRLRGFHNSCLHRGTQLCAGSGNLPGGLVCRFHGWRWGLDGSVREVPDAGDFAAQSVARDALRLPSVKVDTWGGFVFVNFDCESVPLLEFLDPIPSMLDKYAPEKMRYVRRRKTIMPANWKVALEAFSEAYHLTATHIQDLGGIRGGAPQTGFLTRPDEKNKRGATAGSFGIGYSVTDRHGFYSSTPEVVQSLLSRPLSSLGDPVEAKAAIVGHLTNQITQAFAHAVDLNYVQSMETVPLEESVGGFLNRVRREAAAEQGIHYDKLVDYDMLRNLVTVMFPNSSSTILAGNWIFFHFRPNGSDPDSSIFEVDFLHRFPDGEEPAVVQEFYPDWATHADWGITLEQDFANMPHIQRGLHSANGENVRLGRQEVAIRNLHRVLEQYIYGVGVDES